MNPAHLLASLDTTREVLGSYPGDADAMRAIQTLIDAAEAAKADLAQSMEAGQTYRDEGCSTLKAWLRRDLHLDDREASSLIRRGTAMRRLPAVAEHARRGTIRPGHVDVFDYGMRQIGDAFADDEVTTGFVQLATGSEPAQLRATVRELRDVVVPDALDEAYLRGLDRQDIAITKVGDHGYAITGFVSMVLGAKIATLLEAASDPRPVPGDGEPTDHEAPDDDRSPSQRRMDRLETWVDAALEHGLPTDRGIRPHVSVIVDADQLASLKDPERGHLTSPAELVGFGPIGRTALAEIVCNSDLTPFLMDTKYSVLDVGRTQRTAPRRMRRAIETRQGCMCANPGCKNRVRHIHHVTFFSQGGVTSVDNMVGLCASCHRLVHAGLIVIDPTTLEFSRPDRPPQPDNRSNTWLTRRRASRALRQALAAGASLAA